MNERREQLLKEIVETYIKLVKPVGSKALCKKFKCSSATIRNEMAILEDLGLIEKNHISSGRVPSEAGYKYYVEHLMKPKEMTGEDMLKLQTIFQNKDLVLSDAITKCMDIISEITNYTSVVLGKSSADNSLKQVSIIPLNDTSLVALVCTDKGIVENRQYQIPPESNIEEIVKVCELINKELVGTPINEVSKRLEFEIKPRISKKIKQYEYVYNIFLDAFNDFARNKETVHFSGKSNILKYPEYSNAEDIKRIVEKFEDESLVRKIESDNDEVKIYIGKENNFDSNATIVTSKYNYGGEEGTIAIVGPKRMEYAKVVGLLNYIHDNLNKKE